MVTEEQAKLDRLKMPDIGDLLDGRYRIQSLVATGGMGMILQAEQLPMQRPVAIKLLHPHIAASNPKVVDRFQQEVRLAKLLNHPNTIRLYDFGESREGLIYVAMEYLEGLDLKRLIAEEGALPAGRALEITRQMLDGLAEAHSHDFIHRDLKPSNVFITKNRRGEDFVKLLDFGIAKSLDGSNVDLTASGSICGTPGYVAPEYLRSEPLEKASDIYAIGLMLLEMLTGQRVFQAEAAVQTMMMHLQIDPDIPPAIENTPLAAVVRKATAKQPSERYADADVMLKTLEAIIDQVPIDLHVSDYQYPSEQKLSDDAVTPPPQVADKLSATSSSSEFDEDSSASIPEADETPLAMSTSNSSGVHRIGPPPLPAGKERPSPPEGELQAVEDDSVEIEPVDDGAIEIEPTVAATGGTFALSQRRLLFIAGGAAALLALALVIVMAADPGNPAEDGALENASVADEDHQESAASGSLSGADPGGADPSAAAPGEPDPAVAVDAGPEMAQKIRFDLDTDPSGAMARIGERELGTTPLIYEVEPDELPQQVTFEMEGYREETSQLTRDGVPVVVEVLVEAPDSEASAQGGKRSRSRRLSAQKRGARTKSEPKSRGEDEDNGEKTPKKSEEREEKLSDDNVEKVLDELLVE